MGLFDRGGLPKAEHDSLAAAIGARVRVLSWGRGQDGPVVGLPDRLAIGGSADWRFVGWHEIESGAWSAADRTLSWRSLDGRTDAVRLDEPGSLPDLFRERVGATIVVEERFELAGGAVAVIAARRRLDGVPAPLAWSVSSRSGGFTDAQDNAAAAELARLRAEYDIG